ncbi:hypothetical protein [Fundidesulfovibrio magnetotacticus]|uniref:hypothetical protein n=1 Tax=Fundidesulfovibrio magnetotacticus TaxID=2730080 RepID=UPI001566F31D|nr:hypothetical protein [Fundidesulfovibrio magnetotacticus]
MLLACLAGPAPAAQQAPAPAPAQQKAPARADWDFTHVGLKGKLYPSLMHSIAAMHMDVQDKTNELGDRNGLFGITVRAPRAGARAVVEISASSPLVNGGKADVTLPKRGQDYVVYPFLSFPEALLQVRQPVPIVLTARLSVDGQPLGEKSQRVLVASVNDCVYGFEEDDDYYDTSWLFAAYVNENHPAVQQILREALSVGEVSSFSGYQTDARGVRKQAKAVWQALRKRGLRYSSINRPSAPDPELSVQHVRLLGDALDGRQANCVEGSCLLASVFYKIGLETSLVVFPDHMIVGVLLDPKGKQQLFLETTMLGDSTFEEAAKSGAEQVEEAQEKARKAKKKKSGKDDDDDDDEISFIDIGGVRQAGVLPIPEPGRR